ncbi:MAG: SDR family NAD(P)-dependent oxidoreductase, partial [Verrucomicrobiaceae bacterium]
METSSSSSNHSRRNFVGLASGVMAATIAGKAGAQQEREAGQDSAPASPPQSVKANPLEQFAKPPFEKQLQDWPGLAGKMTPVPDHGEKTYKGTGRLNGRKALITGGDSGIGRAAAIAFAREGADVAINYLPAEEDDAKEVVEIIKAAGRKAVAIPGDIQDEKFCQKLVTDAVQALGGLDILVNNAAKQVSVES